MSNRVEDGLQKIWEYLDSGTIELAEQSLTEMENDDHEYGESIELLRVIYYLEIKQFNKAKEVFQPFIVNLDQYSALMKIEILSLDMRIKVLSSDFLKAENAINKITDLLDTLSESDKRQVEHVIPEMRNYTGLINASKGNYHVAISDFEQATMEFRKQDRYRQRGMAMFNHAKILHMLNQNDKSLAILEESAAIFKESNLIESLSLAYDLLIQVNDAKGDRDGSYTYKQLKQDLKEKVEFEKFKQKIIREKEELNTELTKATQKILELEQKLFSMKFSLEAAQEQHGQSLLSEIEKKKIADYDLLMADRKRLQDLVDTREHELVEIQDEISAYKHELNQIVETKQLLAQEMVKNEMLQADIEDLEKQLDVARKEDKRSQEDTDLKKQIVILQNSVTTERMAKEAAEEKISEYKTQIKHLKELVEETKLSTEAGKNARIEELEALVETKDQIIEEQKGKISKLVNQETSRINKYREENQQLRQKIDQSSSDLLQQKDTTIKDLQDRVRVLKAQLEDRDQTIIDLQLTKNQLTQPSIVDTTVAAPVSPGSVISFSRPDTEVDLDNLLASDKLYETIYQRLKSLKSVNLRILAMQSGISPGKCQDAVDELVKTGRVDFDRISNTVSLK